MKHEAILIQESASSSTGNLYMEEWVDLSSSRPIHAPYPNKRRPMQYPYNIQPPMLKYTASNAHYYHISLLHLISHYPHHTSNQEATH